MNPAANHSPVAPDPAAPGSNPAVRVVRVQVDELDPGPVPAPFMDSTMGPFTHWKMNWLRLTADDGVVGQATGRVPDELLPGLLDGESRDPARWWHKLWWMLRNAGHRAPSTAAALHSVDMALRDILAQRAGQPWHRFMGAAVDKVPVYACGGGTNLSVAQLVDECHDFVASGFTTIKMKVGSDFGRRMDEDAQRVRAVRRALGAGVRLAIDANQCWSAKEAVAFAQRVADQDIAWFEEPVHSADRHAIRQVAQGSPIPVAMGESENHWLGFRDLLECGVQHLQPLPMCLPGYERWREALAFAQRAGPAWTCGGYSHLTAMYVASVGAAAGGTVEYLRSIIGHVASCWSVMPAIAGGFIHLPADKPGLPVEVDWKGLASRQAVRSLLDRV